jgi:DNA modification methylase
MDEVMPADEQVDLIFTCPPYADLEVYSDDPADISNMDYPEFMAAYREIIAKAAARLRENRFAVFIVGDVRDRKGFYRNFVGDTIAACEAAGLRYYNEAVLITPNGSLAMRAGNMFRASRKLAKGHQNMLVFAKGEPDATDPIKGLGDHLAKHFAEHRALLQQHEKLLVFAKGDPHQAAGDFGPVLTAEPEAGNG